MAATVLEVLERVGHTSASIKRVAAELSVSVRTLQWALDREDTSFRAIRRRCQIHDAMTLLATTELKITNIAKTVGYTNVANFYRAFSAVAATTPAQFRSQRQQERLNQL